MINSWTICQSIKSNVMYGSILDEHNVLSKYENGDKHTHTHIYIYICVCMCVCKRWCSVSAFKWNPNGQRCLQSDS